MACKKEACPRALCRRPARGGVTMRICTGGFLEGSVFMGWRSCDYENSRGCHARSKRVHVHCVGSRPEKV